MSAQTARLRPRGLIRPPKDMDYHALMAAAEAADERDYLRFGRLSALKLFRIVRRIVLLGAWLLAALPVQTLLVALPGRLDSIGCRVVWKVTCRILGIRVRVIGTDLRTATDRPVIYASAHTSWLDIPVLGSTLTACFIAKAEVAQWPLIRQVAKLGRTLYVSRSRGKTSRERDDMRGRLSGGDNLILFPEGTTSDGSRTLAFRSAFFSLADDVPGHPRPMVQPVTVVYDLLAGLPSGRRSRPIFAWYGDMTIGGHFWLFARYPNSRATIVLHAPLDPADFPDRKALAQAAWQAAAQGSDRLRQNRAPEPVTIAPPGTAPGAPAA